MQEDQASNCASVGRLWRWFGSASVGKSGELASMVREPGWPMNTLTPGANPGEQGNPNPWSDSEDPGGQGRKASWRK